jgi:hypothetical protein
MKRFFTTFIVAFAILNASTQEVKVDFENFGLSSGEYLNGSDGTTHFITEYFSLPIDFNQTYNSWTGWALSATTDSTTAGVENQYSSITGGGVDGSTTYATSYNYIPNQMQIFAPIALDFNLKGMYITNATYTYLSMLNGDGFAKKFGGADGTEPDFFLLTIKGKNIQGTIDSVEFYLADYRFDNNDDDYIVDEWTFIDLSKFDVNNTLEFQLTSSDSGVYGVNTPQYFCIDNFIVDVLSNINDESFADLKLYPNPASDVLNIELKEAATIKIFNSNGQAVISQAVSNNQVDISSLPSGLFNMMITTDKGNTVRKFVKQ